jgi:hypothetical protein
MNMQITDTYILDMNKDELRNFLYYNLDCASFNIKKDCLYNNDQDKLSLIESLYITYSNIHKERYIDLYDKSIMYDRIQHLELALSKISDYFNYEILDKRNNGINLVNPTSNDEFIEIITNIAKTALKDSV